MWTNPGRTMGHLGLPIHIPDQDSCTVRQIWGTHGFVTFAKALHVLCHSCVMHITSSCIDFHLVSSTKAV